MNGKLLVTIIGILLFAELGIAQQVPAKQMLEMIESGRADTVKILLAEQIQKEPDNPDWQFIDAVLTKDGAAAIDKFSAVLKKYPTAKYADAAQYRVYQYYHALGSYKKADSIHQVLQKQYPKSPYLSYISASAAVAVSPEPVKQIVVKTVQPSAAFIVQAGAFVQKNNAESLKKQLLKEGLAFTISERQAAGTVLYVVSATTSTEENAKVIAAKLETVFAIKARVTKNESEKP